MRTILSYLLLLPMWCLMIAYFIIRMLEIFLKKIGDVIQKSGDRLVYFNDNILMETPAEAKGEK